MILTILNETNTKKLENILVENKPEYIFETELLKLPKHIEDGQFKDLKSTLNSMNDFLLPLVIYFMGLGLKILRTS